MERKRKWFVIGIILVVLIGSSVTYLVQRQNKASAAQQRLKAIAAVKGDIESKVHALGTVDSAQTRIFKAEDTKMINQVLVKAGDEVKTGQNLITFVNQDLQSNIVDAKANLQTAEIDAASAERDLTVSNEGRYIPSTGTGKVVKLNIEAGRHIQPNDVIAVVQAGPNKIEIVSHSSGTIESISIKQGDIVQTGETIASLAVDPSLQDKVAKANIEMQQAKDKLNELLSSQQVPPIKAPFNGTIAAVSAASGDEVQKGDQLLELVDLNMLRLTVSVDELDILKLKRGQVVQVTLNAMPGTPIIGKVDSISSLGNVQNGVSTFPVTISLDPLPGVMPGMTGEAYIVTSAKKNILELPIEAVQEKNGRQFVMVENSDGKQVMTKVKIGIHDDQNVEITSGLAEGDRVVIPKSYVIDKGKKKNKNKNGTLKKMFGGGKKAK